MSTTVTAAQLETALKNEFFQVLTEKESRVLEKRFALSGAKQTLEEIGAHFSVTRERIRQIEAAALAKLRRTFRGTSVASVTEQAKDILREKGGVMREAALVAALLNDPEAPEKRHGQILKLALTVDDELRHVFERNKLDRSWALAVADVALISKIADTAVKTLEKMGEDHAPPLHALARETAEALKAKGHKAPEKFVAASVGIDQRIIHHDEKNVVGLAKWRTLVPKTLADKAYVVLEKHGQPMHFTELANAISEAKFDHKVIRTAAVHNEVIRDPRFALQGRAKYGLKKWNLLEGTLAQVLRTVLAAGPATGMTKDEIQDRIEKDREVKPATMVLMLARDEKIARDAVTKKYRLKK